MNQLNITKHPIDRTALIAGIMFTFAGLAYLVDDHGLINVTEGAVAGTVVIVIGLVLLLAAVIDSPTAADMNMADTAGAAGQGGTVGTGGVAESTDDTADFSWATSSAAPTLEDLSDSSLDTQSPSVPGGPALGQFDDESE